MIEEEVIILAEEDEPPSQEKHTQQPSQPLEKEKKKPPLRLLILGALLLLVIAVTTILIMKKDSSSETIQRPLITKAPSQTEDQTPLPPLSQLERMIKKANLLYDGGNRKDALNLFEQIATFSVSISNYNLGVAQMRQERYDEAIQSFEKAIQNGENRCISAINAAVCALYLGDELRFKYYLQMA